jgi:PilZ domain/GYF domain 2
MSNDQTWYIYHEQQQLGPFTSEQVKQLVTTNMITFNAYLFKVGWKDWRPIEDCMAEIGAQNNAIPAQATDERRARVPRATVVGRVVIHNSGKLSIGGGVNISASGIFVETDQEIFVIGENLKLSVRVDGLERAFNALAEVIRFSRERDFPVGYGLRFTEIEEEIKLAIQRLVDQRNRRDVAVGEG